MFSFLPSIVAASFATTTTPTAPRELGPRRAMAEQPLNQLFIPDDYPLRARRHGVEGAVRFSLEIDSAGSVAGCNIVGSSGSPELDEATCRVLRERARFRPALDSRGQPLPDTLTSTVNWRIADVEPFLVFAHEHVVTTISWSEPDPICTEVFNGQPMGRISATECITDFYAPALAVRDARGELQITIVGELVPAGEQGSGVELQGHGERVWFEEVDLVIAPDGRITSCRIVRTGTSPDLPYETGPGHCESYEQTEPLYEPVPQDRGERRARASSAVYMRWQDAE